VETLLYVPYKPLTPGFCRGLGPIHWRTNSRSPTLIASLRGCSEHKGPLKSIYVCVTSGFAPIVHSLTKAMDWRHQPVLREHGTPGKSSVVCASSPIQLKPAIKQLPNLRIRK
jgi:hypothetical protein